MKIEKKPRAGIVITGSDGAIGTSLANKYRGNGFFVVGVDKSHKPISVNDVDIELDLIQLCDDESTQNFFQNRIHEISESYNVNFKVLLNNAALQVVNDSFSLHIEQILDSVKVNAIAPFILARLMYDVLIESEGTILNISSIHTNLTKANFLAYSSSKSMLESITRTLAIEWGEKLNLNCIAPAAVETAMLIDGFAGDVEAVNQLKSFHPSNSIATPEDIASLAYAVSDFALKCKFFNGSVIDISGGISSVLHDPS
ncbi:MAG: SDR family oxidoreductase [Gammaproteobacteria bacterium]|nr:SDR family oxidoreductase [Gammaproteobacteria bacterium]